MQTCAPCLHEDDVNSLLLPLYASPAPKAPGFYAEDFTQFYIVDYAGFHLQVGLET